MSTMPPEFCLQRKRSCRGANTELPSHSTIGNQCFQVWSLNHVALCPHKAFLSVIELILTSKLPVGSTEKLMSFTLQATVWQISKYKKQRGTNEQWGGCYLLPICWSPGTSLSDRISNERTAIWDVN